MCSRKARPRGIFILYALFSLLAGILVPARAEMTADSAWLTFKTYYMELYSAQDINSFVQVEKKYAAAQKQDKLKASEADMHHAPELLFFAFFKSDVLPPRQLLLQKVEVDGNRATIHYTRRNHPEFSGTAILAYEQNAWKLVETIQKTVKRTESGETVTTTSF